MGDLDGDGLDDLAVGAVGEGSGLPTGRVHTFSGATGDRLFTLDSPNPALSGQFGHAVSTAGDVNEDGIPDLVVGAPAEDLSPELRHAGRAYVFDGSNGSLLDVFVSPNSQSAGYFGCSVAAIGDLSGDGLGEVAIGAYAESPGASPQNAGRVYAFSGQRGTVIHTMVSPREQTNGWFGHSLDSAGDVDGDGISDIIIGAYGEEPDRGPEDAGQAYVYSSATCSPVHTLSSPSGTSQGHFGFSVSRLGDLNGDGCDEVVVGAHREDAALRPGRAYVFDGGTGMPIFVLGSLNEEFEGCFGYSISGGNPDGNGSLSVLIGARREDPGADLEDAGRAYLIRPELRLTATRGDGTLILNWTACVGATEYRVYGASNLAYFSPGGPPGFEHLLWVLPRSETSVASPLGIGDCLSNWTYLVVAAAESEHELARTNRAGEQDFCGGIP